MPGLLQQFVYVAVECSFVGALRRWLGCLFKAPQQGLDLFPIRSRKGIEEFGERTRIITQTIAPQFRLMVPVDGAGVGMFHRGDACIEGPGIKLAQVFADQQHLAASGAVACESLVILDGLSQQFGKVELIELIPVQSRKSLADHLGSLCLAFLCRTRNNVSVIRQGSGFHCGILLEGSGN